MPNQPLPGVTALTFPKALVNAFLVEADVLTLIDTGTPGGADRVLVAIRAAGHGEQDLKRILLTHRHSDHAANAADLARVTGASVYCSPVDAPYIREGTEQPRPRPATPLGQVMVPYVKLALPWSVPAVAVHGQSRRGFHGRSIPRHRHPGSYRRPRVTAVDRSGRPIRGGCRGAHHVARPASRSR